MVRMAGSLGQAAWDRDTLAPCKRGPETQYPSTCATAALATAYELSSCPCLQMEAGEGQEWVRLGPQEPAGPTQRQKLAMCLPASWNWTLLVASASLGLASLKKKTKKFTPFQLHRYPYVPMYDHGLRAKLNRPAKLESSPQKSHSHKPSTLFTEDMQVGSYNRKELIYKPAGGPKQAEKGEKPRLWSRMLRGSCLLHCSKRVTYVLHTYK